MNLRETQNCLCSNLRRATRAMTQAYDAALKPAGMTAPQFSLLSVVASNGPLPMQELAASLGLDRTTLTRNLQPLIRDGLVEVRAGEDQRQKLISLGRTGRSKLKLAAKCWRSVQDRTVDGLGAAEAAVLLRSLEGVVRKTPRHP